MKLKTLILCAAVSMLGSTTAIAGAYIVPAENQVIEHTGCIGFHAESDGQFYAYSGWDGALVREYKDYFQLISVNRSRVMFESAHSRHTRHIGTANGALFYDARGGNKATVMESDRNDLLFNIDPLGSGIGVICTTHHITFIK